VIKEAGKEEKNIIQRKFELLYGRARFFQMWTYRKDIRLLGIARMDNGKYNKF
jgi:hypothetical protein